MEEKTLELLSYGSVSKLVSAASEEASSLSELPGLSIESYTVKIVPEINRWSSAEVYMFGVAADADGKVVSIPFGQDQIDKVENFKLIRSSKEGEEVAFLGHGLPLVLPPVEKFLAIRLLLADSDSTARDASEVIKSVSDTVGSKEAIALLTPAVPQAAAVAAVLGAALETATKIMAKNNDDIVETFEGYFTAADMTRQDEFTVETPETIAKFRFLKNE